MYIPVRWLDCCVSPPFSAHPIVQEKGEYKHDNVSESNFDLAFPFASGWTVCHLLNGDRSPPVLRSARVHVDT
jgi:hypothetical protein